MFDFVPHAISQYGDFNCHIRSRSWFDRLVRPCSEQQFEGKSKGSQYDANNRYTKEQWADRWQGRNSSVSCEYPQGSDRQASPADRGHAMAGKGNRRRFFAGRAARDDAGTRSLLVDGLRLAEGRSEAQCLAAVHDELSTDSTFISFMSGRTKRMRFRSSSRTAGPARCSSRSSSSIRSPIRPRMAGRPTDAFHVVIPSMPGYGFSGKPTSTGWGPERMGRAWAELMKRLGYTRYCGARRRLGCVCRRSDGFAGTSGTTCHPHQHACYRSRRSRQGAPGRRPAAIRSLSRRKARVRAAG